MLPMLSRAKLFGQRNEKLGIMYEGNRQCNRDKLAIPYMGKRPMPEIMAQSGKLNTFNISVGDTKFWLLVLEVFDHTLCQVCHTWRKR